MADQHALAGSFTVRATLMQTPSHDRLDIRRDVVIEVGDDGLVVDVRTSPDEVVDVDLGPDGVVLPGLIDTHVHAPQWPQLGTGLDLPLERWLFEYTFPVESKMSDPILAARVWDHMVRRLLAHGTTTAVYYATIDVQATTLLAKTCIEHGQRALVGRTAMDHPDQTPEWYRDGDARSGIDKSLRSIEEIRSLNSPLVRPLVTPRFIPACSDALLEGLGELAQATGAGIQTHCSESDWEHDHVLDRFGIADARALDKFALIDDHTILAHGTHIDATDLTWLIERGAGIAHCPLSNAYFSNAVFPARRALEAGARVGLGTDIAGGASPGVLGQCAHAVTASRYLEAGVDVTRPPAQRGVADSRIDSIAAFWMATGGGAELIGEPIGLIDVGRPFDAIAVATSGEDSSLMIWPEVDDDQRVFEKITHLVTAGDIDHVWVGGRHVR